MNRQDVPKEHTWDLSSVFATQQLWEAERLAVIAELPALSAYAGRLGESPDVLADFMALHEAVSIRRAKVITYANMEAIADTGDAQAQARRGQAISLASQYAAATAFSEPELQALGQTLFAWADQQPRLAQYRHYFDDLVRQKLHLRSAEVEEVLGLLIDPFSGPQSTASALTDSDLQFADAIDSHGQALPVRQTTIPPTGIQSHDREQRRTAWESFCDGHLGVKDTLASNYLTCVKQQIFDIRVRSYDSVLHSRLSPGNASTEIFHNLINAFKSNLSTWHRYWDVRRRLLGVDALRPYDQWAPLQDDEPPVPYEQAIEWCCASMEPLGAEYVEPLRRGCGIERWVDYEPNVGKRQGAASVGGFLGSTRNFLYLSYDGTLQSVSVLAHELGHSMHGYLANQAQPVIYRNMGMSMVAETASNFNQALLRAYLMRARADDDAFQLALLDEAMFNFHRYFFIMPTLARFEWEVYERAEQGKPLNVDILNGLAGDLFAEGYGSALEDDPERTTIAWAQFQHLFSPFYTFQYAVGISAAHAMAQGVLDGDEEARESYLRFLRSGGSVYALDAFAIGGVDMTTPEPIEQAFGVLDDIVNRLEALI